MSGDTQMIRTEYSDIMKKSYIDYAMSVIISRALPDVRDGLKPVQRRTLYDMNELGIYYDRPYRKCARIVGDTMGKYHPHGDSSIYDALVVMAQDFKKGMTLVDGHGNFGSVEGDGAAAMRYTEAKLTKYAQEVYLTDLDKDVVDFGPNFDESEKEPLVLPSRIPNLLVNGAEGIAVGMVTSIPTHNLSEVADAVIAYIKNNEITTKELMNYIKGPDFPTGGIVVNKDELLDIYQTGRGKIRIRGKVDTEELKNGKKRLVVSQIPYTMIGSGISKFLNDVSELAEHRKTNDITDISNQSSKDGIRIVIELKKDADAENLKNMLYRKTRLEDTFGVNMLAVAGTRPKALNLKGIIEHHVDFQFEVTTRKYRTLLTKEQEKKEIQEGLIKACGVIDLIIEILRGSKTVKDARQCLINGVTENIKFKTKVSRKMASLLRFTEKQADAILQMRLYRLIGLEVDLLMKEHEATLKNIARYEDILNNYDSMADLIIKELKAYKKQYGRARRTAIVNAEEARFEEIKDKEQEVIFLMDRFGYAKTVDAAAYDRNREAADRDNKYVIRCLNTGKVCIFTDTGFLHQIKISDLPYGKLKDKGVPIDNISNYAGGREQTVAVFEAEALSFTKLLFATKQGMVKTVDGGEFKSVRRTVTATKLTAEDCLVAVRDVKPRANIVLCTKNGYFLRLLSGDIPEKKKGAVGVRGIRLHKNDALEAVYLFEEGDEAKAVCGGKEVVLNKLRRSGRDTSGTKVRV